MKILDQDEHVHIPGAFELFSSECGCYLNWCRLYDPQHPSEEPISIVEDFQVAASLYYASLVGVYWLVKGLIRKGAM
jgi:hypothetical protein